MVEMAIISLSPPQNLKRFSEMGTFLPSASPAPCHVFPSKDFFLQMAVSKSVSVPALLLPPE